MQHLNEEQSSGTSESAASAEPEIRRTLGEWSKLPFPPLEKIYSFLGRKDQVNMSLVCRHWSKGYGSSSVWKRFIFDLTESQLLSDNCPVMKFVPKYSRMFKHVEIRYQAYLNGKRRWIAIWCKKFRFFMKNLTSNSKLISVKFEFLGFSLYKLDIPTSDIIYRTIVDFVRYQLNLKRVDFYKCEFFNHDGFEILRTLAENSRETLTHLALESFNYFKLRKKGLESYDVKNMPILLHFPRLTTLEIDFSMTFLYLVRHLSTTIGTVKNCQTLKLTKIILRYVSEFIPKFEDAQALTSTDWRLLKMLYPDLEIELELEFHDLRDFFSHQDFEFLIAPDMPIIQLDCTFTHLKEKETREFFSRLLACNINDHLVSLTLEWQTSEMNLAASTIIPFLQNCKKLKSLELCVVNPVFHVDILMQYLLENRPESLERVVISINEVREVDDYINLWSLFSEYESQFLMVGLNLEVNFIFDNQSFNHL